jgi:hypothetical protein|tara:strand:+ start:232 stop:660 length:429 start_codon:yes stop_codon:yes gene_type:complete
MAKKKKRKSKIKKLLKGAAIAGGALLAAKALSGRGGTAAKGTKAPDFVKGIPTYQHKDDIMKFPNRGIAVGVDYNAGPFERSRIAENYGIDTNTIGASPVDRRDPNNFLNTNRITDYMSKGGRVGVGKAKRGFGRAMKKGRK